MSAPPIEYQPTSRRPIAATFRKTANAAVALCVKLKIHPDGISYFSIVASLAAAICFWQSQRWISLLIVAPLFCYLRLWLNMLDGMVALASGKASRRGEILNDLPDRISDILIFAGVAHSHLMHPLIGYWTIILALMTAYVGTLSQAVGAKRQFNGIMSKPWRMVLLHIGAWITLVLFWLNHAIQFGNFTVLDLTCLLIILGCVQTIWVRLARTLQTLGQQG
jgi:phosphatidylglycerophosphate synthase